MTQKKRVLNAMLWAVGIASLLFFSLGITWKISTAINFNYSTWYDVLTINKTIEQYAKQNNFEKSSFQTTDKTQHILLFSDIVNSVTNSGNGLNEIVYITKNNESVKLLTLSEIVHLRDVSILIDKLTIAWYVNTILLVTLRFLLSHYEYKQPSVKSKLGVLFAFVFCVVCLFGFVGFTSVFYYLHTVIFPDEHQWFFYYQDSLMSTLMKAPDLFEMIGIMLCVMNIPIYYLSNQVFKYTHFNSKE